MVTVIFSATSLTMENRLANDELGDAARVPGSTIPISTVLHLTRLVAEKVTVTISGIGK